MREKSEFFCWSLEISPNTTSNVLLFQNNSKSLCWLLQLEKWWRSNLHVIVCIYQSYLFFSHMLFLHSIILKHWSQSALCICGFCIYRFNPSWIISVISSSILPLVTMHMVMTQNYISSKDLSPEVQNKLPNFLFNGSTLDMSKLNFQYSPSSWRSHLCHSHSAD